MLRTCCCSFRTVRASQHRSVAATLPVRLQPPLQAKQYSSSRSGRASPQSRSSVLLAGGLAVLAGGAWFLLKGDDAPKRLSYSYFTPLKLESVQAVTPDSSILTLKLPPHLLPDPAAYPEPADTPLQAIYVRQPELQIQRAYTPLTVDCFSSSSQDQDRHIQILVKRYNDGEVSSYLHRLRPNDDVYVRGPVRTWTLPQCDELVFIAGGTGLTPLAQLLSHHESPPKRVKVIYASSSPEHSFKETLLGTTHDVELREVYGRISRADLRDLVGKPDKAQSTQILVCGPEGFINSIAGPRQLNAQADTVGGLLADLGWSHANVKKL